MQISPGTTRFFPSIYLPHLLHLSPCSYGLQLVTQSYPQMQPYMRFLCVRPEVCPRVSMFPESSFLQISSRDEHPCFRLCPSHYRADSGLAPARNVRRRAHVSTTSPAGGSLSPFQGIIAFPPKGGLRNRSICYWWPLKSGL